MYLHAPDSDAPGPNEDYADVDSPGAAAPLTLEPRPGPASYSHKTNPTNSAQHVTLDTDSSGVIYQNVEKANHAEIPNPDDEDDGDVYEDTEFNPLASNWNY